MISLSFCLSEMTVVNSLPRSGCQSIGPNFCLIWLAKVTLPNFLSSFHAAIGLFRLSVCIVQGYSFEVIDCQAVESWTMEQLVVDIPQFDESIRIALKADSSNGAGIVAIDNIVFEAKNLINYNFIYN